MVVQVVKKAIAFATQAHEGQFRKGTTRPFIVHPLEVGQIVATLTEDEEIISAAFLHDTVEDCPDKTSPQTQIPEEGFRDADGWQSPLPTPPSPQSQYYTSLPDI